MIVNRASKSIKRLWYRQVLSQGACIIKHFTVVINFVVAQASAFAVVSHSLLALTNTLAFYITELITAVISFMIQAPGANVIKLFTVISYVFL